MEGVPQSSRCIVVPADKRQKTDSFPDRQKEALNLRAMARFGKAVGSGKLAVGGVFPVMIKSFQSFTPSNVTMLDARRMLSGGYVQRNVRLTLALVVAEEGGKFDVELEEPVYIGYHNGPTTPSASYRFCDFGVIQYSDGGVWKDWTGFFPEWSSAGEFPLVPDAFSGFDLV